MLLRFRVLPSHLLNTFSKSEAASSIFFNQIRLQSNQDSDDSFKKKQNAAKEKLNSLLKSIVDESKDDSSKNAETVKMNIAIKPKSERKVKLEVPKKDEKPQIDPMDQKLNEKILKSARKVAENMEGDPKITESELVQKLKQQSELKLDMSELISGMKIDREKPISSDVESLETSRAERVQRMLQEKENRQQSRFKKEQTAFIKRDSQPQPHQKQMRREREPRDQSQRGKHPAPINIFGGKGLNIFRPKEIQTQKEPEASLLKTWDALAAKELKMLMTHPPANGFEEMILWTEQKKLWRFPIDNEQDMDEEKNISFTEHVFLEPKIDNWCPKKGPIRHFMHLVCVSLSKNPHLSAKEKEEYLVWYRDYFIGKNAILKETGVGEISIR